MWLTLREEADASRRPSLQKQRRPRRVRSVRGAVYFAAWILWLLMGTLFYGYARDNRLGFVRGFYMAVNIGYSIGWGDISELNPNYFWFSSLYVLMGASLVAVALGFFANRIVQDMDNWFTNLLQQEEYEREMHKDNPLHTKAMAWAKHNWEPIRSIFLWVLWLAIMMLYSMVQIRWPFNSAQYFAISSLSTGGHLSIPNTADEQDRQFSQPTWIYGLTGFMCATGIPLMAVAMSSVANLMVDPGDLDYMKELMKQGVTTEEIEMLQRFELENGDGQIDRAEFIILCVLRCGADPELIAFISERFEQLDKNRDGGLSMGEICIDYASNRHSMDKKEGNPESSFKEDEGTLATSVSPSPSFETEVSPVAARKSTT